MSTINRTMTGETLLVASGPQNVTISFDEGTGDWFLQDGNPTTAPTARTHGHELLREPASMALVADQGLYVRGTGKLVLTCTTPAI